MNTEPWKLTQIERWMQAVITHPDGVEPGIQSEQARSAIDVALSDVEQVVTRSQSLSSIERLQVYAHAYYARLLECLREEFPALAHAVGGEAFDGFAFGYLQAYPSRSYTLSNLGASFPKYLDETRPRGDAAESPDWTAFVIDLARLERAYSEVFDGPGVERECLLTLDDLLAIDPQRWPQARLVSVPCLRLVTFRFPVHEYATAVRHGREIAPPAASPTYLAITRRDFVVRRFPLSRAQFELLAALDAGESITESITRSADTVDMHADEFAAHLHDWFREWAASGLFWKAEFPAAR